MAEDVSDGGWPATLARGLHQAWQTRLFTDLVITTRDEVIHAHKVILAAASPYFRAMLSVGLVEGRTQSLVLEDVAGAVLNTVLTYVYTGRAPLDQHNITNVLTLADYFQIYDLKKLCCYYLKNHLVMETCLSVYEVASLHRCHDLATDALALGCSQCSQVLGHPAFLSLLPETLLTLLKQPYLNIESEEELLNAVVRWAAEDPDERQKWLVTLLQNIDLGHLNAQTRIKWIATLEEKQLLSEDLRHIVASEITSSRTENCSVDQDESSKKTRHNSQEEVLLVMGGESNGRLLGNVECFALGYSSWRCSIPDTSLQPGDRRSTRLQVLPAMKQPRAYCAVATRHNLVHVLGGQTSNTFLASCECYRVSSNTWHRFPDLPAPVHGAAATFLDGVLYFAGGRSQKRYQHELLVYDESSESWVGRGSLSEGRGHFGLVALHGSLFAVGGVAAAGGTSRVLRSCEKFDPGSDTWVPIAPLGQARSYLGVAVVQDQIYAIGGYDGSRWLCSVEKYDPLSDQWTSVSSMISARSSFGVTVSHGRIFCLGGFSGESNLNTVEKYNPRTNMWHCVQSMQLRRFGLVAATVSVPASPPV
ncbi:kelch-like protein 20 isoform X2 [Procambarus clarkii]|nr:kelch-like protein 5 isoform X2 [Procambarus clarkii]XP_045601855.1 kelch-like protein 5 isoform X2 [Procambarus clarkii]XP_045601856.1 kelch-like protein 5 isoform X2 [Procambarus clarkii]XP_045601857.1 kelch-like protein 5 isoform X2 [Procambarus clarkii]